MILAFKIFVVTVLVLAALATLIAGIYVFRISREMKRRIGLFDLDSYRSGEQQE